MPIKHSRGRIILGFVVLACCGFLWWGAGGDDPDGTNRGMRLAGSGDVALNAFTGSIRGAGREIAKTETDRPLSFLPFTILVCAILLAVTVRYGRTFFGDKARLMAVVVVIICVLAVWQAAVSDINAVLHGLPDSEQVEDGR